MCRTGTATALALAARRRQVLHQGAAPRTRATRDARTRWALVSATPLVRPPCLARTPSTRHPSLTAWPRPRQRQRLRRRRRQPQPRGLAPRCARRPGAGATALPPLARCPSSRQSRRLRRRPVVLTASVPPLAAGRAEGVWQPRPRAPRQTLAAPSLPRVLTPQGTNRTSPPHSALARDALPLPRGNHEGPSAPRTAPTVLGTPH